MKMRTAVVVSLLSAAIAWAQPKAPAPPMAPQPPGPPMMGPPPGVGPMMGPGMGMGPPLGPPGIPPALAQKVGISPEAVKKVRDLSFEANDALITLEADLKRAQLDLEKAMTQPTIDDSTVMLKLESVSKAELAVRKNRIGLMLKIRKTVGAEAWEKLQAEMPMGPGHMGRGMGMGMGMGPGVHREVRIIREGNE